MSRDSGPVFSETAIAPDPHLPIFTRPFHALRTGGQRLPKGKLMTKDCARCGTRFTATTQRARFCSGSCRAAASKARSEGLPERVGASRVVELRSVEGDRIATQSGSVRHDLEAWLRSREQIGHPLATAALAVADRIDRDTDALSGMAVALGRLQDVMAELSGQSPRLPDTLDLLRLRAHAKAAGVDLSDALDADAIHAIAVAQESSPRTGA